MKKIYHTHTSSNSFLGNSWTEEDWFLCDTEEEYQNEVQKCRDEVAEYQEKQAKHYGSWRFKCSEEEELHAREYYYGHEWQGKNFDCEGVCFERHLERSNHYKYIIKPNSVRNMQECTDRGIGWMYGS